MTEFKLTTAVAFTIFNRPETTERVFAEIAKAEPPMLLVVGDGPRTARAGEAEKVAATRAIVQRINSSCEVLTNFSDVNLGCEKRVTSGIDWIFEQVEEAIILEDDCLPDPTFFRYCQEMLERYRHERRIGTISGANFQFGRRYGGNSYYFSKYSHSWGWATWRDRWVGTFDVTMAKWPRVRDEALMPDMVGDVREALYWEKLFESVYVKGGYDHQWTFANWVNGRLSIVPSVNLISNIGFGPNATHTTLENSDMDNVPRSPITFPLSHPIGVFACLKADRFTDKKCHRLTLWKRVRRKLYRSIDTMKKMLMNRPGIARGSNF